MPAFWLERLVPESAICGERIQTEDEKQVLGEKEREMVGISSMR